MKLGLYLKAAVIIIFGALSIVANIFFSDVTDRGYLNPIGKYTFKFDTHGGVVYVDEFEHSIIVCYKYGVYLVGAAALIMVFVPSNKRKNSNDG